MTYFEEPGQIQVLSLPIHIESIYRPLFHYYVAATGNYIEAL